MKKILFSVFTSSIITFSACNSGDKSAEESEMSKMDKDTTQNSTTSVDSNIAVVTPTFTNLDPRVSESLKTVIDHYLHIKSALANDNANEAANGGKAMALAMNKVDKSLMTPEQKRVYDENEADLKEHAEHISNSPLDHQREHFSMMSEDVYALAKAFGGRQTLYHDHCPMYNDKKGAMWLSETIEIRNPYYGSKMPKCGKVQRKIKA